MNQFIDVEAMRRAASVMDEAAETAKRAAGTIEESVHKLTTLLEDGHGGNALKLIELLESLPAEFNTKVDRFVKFTQYGINQSAPYVNAERVSSFSLISYNGNHGTEIQMDDGTTIRVREWPEDVAKMLSQPEQKV